eukprot:Hpha_TRINITY_DN12284_c1_g1::TRINITY_DN12284_c1_g1_i2::g.16707::m.16707
MESPERKPDGVAGGEGEGGAEGSQVKRSVSAVVITGIILVLITMMLLTQLRPQKVRGPVTPTGNASRDHVPPPSQPQDLRRERPLEAEPGDARGVAGETSGDARDRKQRSEKRKAAPREHARRQPSAPRVEGKGKAKALAKVDRSVMKEAHAESGKVSGGARDHKQKSGRAKGGHGDRDRGVSVIKPGRDHVAAEKTSGGTRKRYTVVLNAFRRDGCVLALTRMLMGCPRSGTIHIVWNDARRSTPAEFLRLIESSGGKVVVDRYPDGNITNRYNTQYLTTKAVFSLDDDEVYSCRLIEFAFSLWLRDPNAMVGFAPRHVLLKGTSPLVKPGTPSGYAFQAPYAPEWKNRYGGYFNTCFVTKGAFLHRRFFEMFWKPTWRKEREQVNRSTTAEDILMSVVHSMADGGTNKVIPVNVPSEDYFMMRCHDEAEGSEGDGNSKGMDTKDKNKKGAPDTKEKKKKGGTDTKETKRKGGGMSREAWDFWWSNTLSVRTSKKRLVIMDNIGARLKKSVFPRDWWFPTNVTSPDFAPSKRPWVQCNRNDYGTRNVLGQADSNVTRSLARMRRDKEVAGKAFCII